MTSTDRLVRLLLLFCVWIAIPVSAAEPSAEPTRYLVISLHDAVPGTRATVSINEAEFVGAPKVAAGSHALEILKTKKRALAVSVGAASLAATGASKTHQGPFGIDGSVEQAEGVPPTATFAVPFDSENTATLAVTVSVPSPAYALTSVRSDMAVAGDAWLAEVHGRASSGVAVLDLNLTRRRDPPGCQRDCEIATKSCKRPKEGCYVYYSVFYCCINDPY